AARRGHAEVAAEGCSQDGPGGGDLVLGLNGAHAEVLMLGKLVEDVRRRRDRIAGVEERELRALGRRDETPRDRCVSGDVAVAARREVRAFDLVLMRKQLGRLAEIVARTERAQV